MRIQRCNSALLLSNFIIGATIAHGRLEHNPFILQQARSLHRQIHTACIQSQPLRVWTVSDLHTDHSLNMEWIVSLQYRKKGDEFDVLIVSGDISGCIERIENTLNSLKKAYHEVIFVPGNHDVWVERDKDQCSINKLLKIFEICKNIGVRTDPICFTGVDVDLLVVPLLSWYHASWDKEPNLPPELQHRNGNFLRRWADFRSCQWDSSLCSQNEFVSLETDSKAIADFFASLNDKCIAEVVQRKKKETHIISCSHFVPRQELCPEKRFLFEPNLMKVIGSDPLERQIRELGSNLHLFGHTHIPIDMTISGVRYMQWPLGSPREQKRQCKNIAKLGPHLLYNTGQQTGFFSKGSFLEKIETFWGSYYEEYDRDLSKIEVPAWAMQSR